MRTTRRQGRVGSPGPSVGGRCRGGCRPVWPLAGCLKPGSPRTLELRGVENGANPALSAEAGSQGEGGGVLVTSTTLTLTLTTVGLSRCHCPARSLSTPRNPMKWRGQCEALLSPKPCFCRHEVPCLPAGSSSFCSSVPLTHLGAGQLLARVHSHAPGETQRTTDAISSVPRQHPPGHGPHGTHCPRHLSCRIARGQKPLWGVGLEGP